MTDQQQRTQWALDMFRSFTDVWVARGARDQQSIDAVENTIRAIAPKGTDEPIGYAVFKREMDTDWDIRQRPSGLRP